MASFRKPRRRRMLAAVGVAAVIAVATYTYTASNTVPASNAGAGSGTVSGFTASSVQYNPNSSNPDNLDSVTFTISPTTARVAKIQLASGGSWYSCTNTSGSVSCTTTSPQASVSGSSQLTMLAVQ